MQKFIAPRLNRLRSRWLGIIQVGIAAGIAFWFGTDVAGHEQPFFAPMAAVIVLGLTGGDRLRRSVELVVGVSLGVGLGDLYVSYVGTGLWQMSLMIMLSLALAVFVDRSPLVSTQAAIGAVLIATIMPPGTNGGFERMYDAFIGGLIGLITVAVIPKSPLSAGRLEIAKVLGLASRTLKQVAGALPANNTAQIQAALQQARGSQTAINAMIAAAKEGQETSFVSPLLWHERRRVKSLVRILNPVDNAMRNTRVLSRRAVVLTEDKDSVSDEQIFILQELAEVMGELATLYAGSNARGAKGDLDPDAAIPGLVHRLRHLGALAGEEVCADRVLSAKVVLAQSRSIIVDLLQICGMSRHSAVAVLRPTSAHPAMPPEIWDGE